MYSMCSRELWSSGRSQQLYKLCSGLKPDGDGLDQLLFVRCREVLSRERCDEMQSMSRGSNIGVGSIFMRQLSDSAAESSSKSQSVIESSVSRL